MGFHHNPDIVTSGLIFAVDAANSKSYTGIASPWRDMTKSKYSMIFTNSPTYSSANRGAIVFDGINDSCPANEDFANNLSTMTVCAWVKTSAAVSLSVPIVAKCSDYDLGAGWGLILKNSAGVRLGFFIQETLGNNVVESVASFITTNDNTWHHVSAVIANFVDSPILYQDGQVIAVNVAGGGTVTNISTTTKVGIGGSMNQGFFNGSISGVQIYNRVLSASEIKQNFNATRGRYSV